jgi:CheY-like chemotaxis protein
MTQTFTLFIVDDDDFSLKLLELAFVQTCKLEFFSTAEACLARLNEDGCVPPDLFLLDVDLPGMNGYALCRQIQQRPGLEKALAIFISGYDNIGARLEGYDAGGIDYVVKPYNMAELKKKVGSARHLSVDRLSLNDRLQESKLMNLMVLSNMGEYAVLIAFLRALNDCANPRALLDSLFNLLQAFQLQCAVQLRLPGFETTLSKNGENIPLEVAVINHVRGMERIFEFKMRAVYNFEHLTILINNLPHHDQDLCGRLRDHIAIAAECADAKLKSLQIKAEHTQAKDTAADLLSALQSTVENFDHKYVQARSSGSSLTQDLFDELAGAFSSLGLSEVQEARIQNIVQAKAFGLAEIYDFSNETQGALTEIAERLAGILNPSTAPGGENATPSVVTSESPRSAIELF